MAIKPLNIRTKLANTPKGKPLFSKEVKLGEKTYLCGDPRATRAMVALMDLAAVNGGAASHWGGPSAMAEMMSAVHAVMFQKDNWFDHYNFVNDIGHAENGIYALRANLGFGDIAIDTLKGFRSIHSKLTGHGESHLYPEGVLLSNGPLASALPQAQGLAAADKLLGNTRVTITSVSDGASMEGEAKEAFAAIPGLFSSGKLNPFIMIVSDNNTKLSGRIDEDSFSMQGTFESLSNLGWNVIEVSDGHDLKACLEKLELALNVASSAPVCLLTKTIKGKGNKKTEESKTGGHGFPLKAYSNEIKEFIQEIWGEEKLPEVFSLWADELINKPEVKNSPSAPSEKMQVGLANAAISMAQKGYPVVSVSCDLQGSTGIAPFHKEFPERSFDVGIAESNMVSMAAGLSKLGFIPMVDTFAAFGITKGNLPLVMASLSEAPMIAFFSHAGFQDAADGASHQSLTYLSALASVPHLKTVVLSTSGEAEYLVSKAIEDIKTKRENNEVADSYIFFLGRENFPKHLTANEAYEFGKAQVLKEGSDVTILSQGPLIHKALEASKALKEKGINAEIINNPFTNHVDIETIGESLKKTKKLVTVEDHQVIGGMGAQATHALKRAGFEFKLISLGVNNSFGQSAYTADELYEKHGLDAHGIVAACQELKGL